MQPTHLTITNTTAHIPLGTYLLLTFGGAWLIWLPLGVVCADDDCPVPDLEMRRRN